MEKFDTLKQVLFIAAVLGALAVDGVVVRLLPSWHRTPLAEASKGFRRVAALVLLALIVCSAWAMSLNPIWNGDYPDYRDQYERLADAFLDGHLYIDYGPVDPALLAMDNPYDWDARMALGVDYHWDHAFYNGHYYMYFGVVPVLLLFLPFKALTGLSLTTYHATQLFVALFFCGVFALFRLLGRRFCPKMPIAAWLLLTVTTALSSVWNAIACPALYNTAISSALCLEIWSLYFFIKAVWDTEGVPRALRRAFLGALFGALAFGCRPSAALGNLVAIPLLVTFLKRNRLRGADRLRLAGVFLPYVLVAAGLMWYNNARFGSPFEFGQAYQLTVADQSQYGSMLSHIRLVPLLNGLIFNFFRSPTLRTEFPYVGAAGIFVLYPVFCWSFAALARRGTRDLARREGLGGLLPGLGLTAVIITCLNVLWVPYLTDRYLQDVTWLIAVLSFLAAGLYLRGREDPERCSRWICRLCVWSLAVGFLLFAEQLLITE